MCFIGSDRVELEQKLPPLVIVNGMRKYKNLKKLQRTVVHNLAKKIKRISNTKKKMQIDYRVSKTLVCIFKILKLMKLKTIGEIFSN